MRPRYKFIYVKWCLFVLIQIYMLTGVISDTSETTKICVASFNDTWFSRPRDYYRIILVTKHIGKILFDMINMPRHTVSERIIEKSVHLVINSVIDGFDFIGNITKNRELKDKNLPSSKSHFILTSKYRKKLTGFFQFLEEIERIYSNDFKKIRDHSTDNSNILDSFYNETIESINFRKNLLLEEYCNFPNETNSFSTQEFNKTIFHMYFDALQELVNFHYVCDESMIKLITDFYERIVIDVVKGYAMLIIGYEFYRLNHPGYNIKEIQIEHFHKYLRATNKILYSAKELDVLITLKHRANRKCDSSTWKEGKNYIRVKNYVTDRAGYVGKNNDNYKLKSEMSNEYECDDFGIFSNFATESIDSMRCPEVFELDSKACSGVESKEFVFPINDYRNWSVACYDKTSYSNVFKNLCYCDQQSDVMLSIRTLSLREHNADSYHNRVVTGIKFVVKNNVLSITIQEGTMADGIVDPTSVRWVPGNGEDPEKGPSTVKLGFKIKSFNLDDIDLPDEYFVTGVKFVLLEDNHIGLGVRGTQMWSMSGSKPSLRYQWFYADVSSRDDREQIYIKDYRNSAEVTVKNVETSRSGSHYIDLSVGVVSSQFNNLPLIPFFDSQKVVSNPPSPLGGMGFFYKGQPSYGGFFAFKLIASRYSYDFYSDIIAFNNH